MDFDYKEVNQNKKIFDPNYGKSIINSIDEIGNDIDQPDEDLIKLMNSSKDDKKAEKEKSPEKVRKLTVSNKYKVEPIKEENVIDYIPPKKNSFLSFLERNDLIGKVSYNKKERESLFFPLETHNLNNLHDSEKQKALIENYKKFGRSQNPHSQNILTQGLIKFFLIICFQKFLNFFVWNLKIIIYK